MRRVLFILTLAVILGSTWIAFTYGEVAPEKDNLTVVKNIVYVHVPSAHATVACLTLLCAMGIWYLATGNPKCDRIGAAAAEVALIFATVLNITGSIFARPYWNTWWTPSPRLISSAMLWFLCIAYLILRANIQNPRRRARICAVFGIIAYLDVPIVLYTARKMEDMHIPNVSFETTAQAVAFGLSILGGMLLAGILMQLKIDILECKAKLESDLTR